MPILKAANVEPIRGYRLIGPLGKGGFGEVWKCEAPGGIFKTIKFVYGDLNGPDDHRFRAEEELRAFQLIKSIRHPFLLSIDRVEVVDGELVIVAELADQNLHELKVSYQSKGLAGIPRPDLLTYLRETAEVLDLLNEKFDLQHLDVKPRNLFLVSNHVKVADFGLVNSLSAGRYARAQPGAVTPLYAAPELFDGRLSRQCDQYSLAIVYQELLTGKLPFAGDNGRALLMQHSQAAPDLEPLPEAERPIIARALSKKPEDRYGSCLEFLRELAGNSAMRKAPAEAPLAAKTTETLQAAEVDTVPLRPPALKPPVGPDVLPGARFHQCLGSGPLGDAWLASIDDHTRLVKVLYGLSAADPKGLEQAILQLKSIHHPALFAAEVVDLQPGRLVLLSDPIRETLHDRFHDYRGGKQPGVPRGELRQYLRAAAEVLDYLYQQYGLFHLNLHPRQLVLDRGWLQVAEFGFAQLLWLSGGQDVAARNPRYAAPELFERSFTRASDQYSLALIYAELLTGVHPYHQTGYHAKARRQAAPDLERLPPVDREVIARALDPDPLGRWPNCTEMCLALEGTSLESVREMEAKGDSFSRLIDAARGAPRRAIAGATKADLNQIIKDIIAKAGGDASATAAAAAPLPPVLQDGVLRHSFQVSVPVGSARGKLEGFAQQWFGRLVRDDEQGIVFRINLPTTFWQSLFRRQAGLEAHIRIRRVNPISVTPIEVDIRVQPLRAGHQASLDLLSELGPDIVDSLRAQLLSSSEKRVQDRLLWPHPLKITPIRPDGAQEEPLECRGKDISRSGIGFYLPQELDTSDVLIELPNTIHPPAIAIPATLVRAKRCADGWYEVGALFRLPSLRKSLPEIMLPPVEETAARV